MAEQLRDFIESGGRRGIWAHPPPLFGGLITQSQCPSTFEKGFHVSPTIIRSGNDPENGLIFH